MALRMTDMLSRTLRRMSVIFSFRSLQPHPIPHLNSSSLCTAGKQLWASNCGWDGKRSLLLVEAIDVENAHLLHDRRLPGLASSWKGAASM